MYNYTELVIYSALKVFRVIIIEQGHRKVSRSGTANKSCACAKVIREVILYTG